MAEKILIVDDDLDTLRLVGLILQRQGYEIAAANSGQQALNMTKEDPPDLILLDVMIPDLDGYEVTRRLRADLATKNIPIIMFTAKSNVDDKVTGFEVGADDYLTKPTQPRELFAHVKAVLARSGKPRPETHKAERVRGRLTAIIGVKGGLGASTLALNLGVCLRQQTNKEVIVAEFRPGQGSLSQDLGYLKPEGINHLVQLKTKDIIRERVQRELVTHASGVKFLFSSYRPHDSCFVDAIDSFVAIAQQISALASYGLIDLGPSLTPLSLKVLEQVDEVIAIFEPVPSTIIRAKALMDDLKDLSFDKGRVVTVLINRIRSDHQLTWSQVQEQLGHQIAVVFTPAFESAYQAAKNNIPLVTYQPENLATQQFYKLADIISRDLQVAA